MTEQTSPDVLRYSPDEVKGLFSSGKARLITPKKEFQEPTGDLVKSETEAWRTFLGKDVDVPPVPQELLETQQRTQEKVDDSATSLDGNWVLIDKTPKPQYDNGRQSYESDSLAPLMARVRDEEKIKGSPTPTSRFSTSWNELDKTVLPELAHDLGIRDDQVRLPKAIEFNVLGNMHHKEWGETTTWEWFEDKFESGSRLIGGRSGDGGLAHVGWDQPGLRSDSLGFRPLIVFPS